jgi:hypothetical protein
VITDRTHPAAYIRAARGHLDRYRQAIAEGARQRGWPPPLIYTDDDTDPAAGHTPALQSLHAAIEAGRHDALLITEPGAVTGTAPHLLPLLQHCTRNGVIVGFLLPPVPARRRAKPPRDTPRDAAFPLNRSAWGVLARARIEALTELFPSWQIWLDQHGWHARRRDTSYLQLHIDGAPAFSVHAVTPTDLAAQLCWQQAADQHTPHGCPTAQQTATPD